MSGIVNVGAVVFGVCVLGAAVFVVLTELGPRWWITDDPSEQLELVEQPIGLRAVNRAMRRSWETIRWGIPTEDVAEWARVSQLRSERRRRLTAGRAVRRRHAMIAIAGVAVALAPLTWAGVR